MAFYDNTLLLSNAQSLAGAATTVISTSTYDITGAGSGVAPSMTWGTSTFLAADVMIGQPMYAYFTTTTAFSATTALTVRIQAAQVATGNVPGTWVNIYQSQAFVGATDLAISQQLVVPIPPVAMIADYLPRFYRFAYVNTTAATFSAGAFTAGILLNAPTGMVSTLYPNNFASGL